MADLYAVAGDWLEAFNRYQSLPLILLGHKHTIEIDHQKSPGRWSIVVG